MDWRYVDGRLIRRGELLLSLDFLKGYGFELKSMNDCRVGLPFKIMDGILFSWLLYATYSPCPIGSLRASLGL